jgi:hypothetical protein
VFFLVITSQPFCNLLTEAFLDHPVKHCSTVCISLLCFHFSILWRVIHFDSLFIYAHTRTYQVSETMFSYILIVSFHCKLEQCKWTSSVSFIDLFTVQERNPGTKSELVSIFQDSYLTFNNLKFSKGELQSW